MQVSRGCLWACACFDAGGRIVSRDRDVPCAGEEHLPEGLQILEDLCHSLFQRFAVSVQRLPLAGIPTLPHLTDRKRDDASIGSL